MTRFLRIRSADGARVLCELTDEGHEVSVESLADALAVIDVLSRSCLGFYRAPRKGMAALEAENQRLQARIAELEQTAEPMPPVADDGGAIA